MKNVAKRVERRPYSFQLRFWVKTHEKQKRLKHVKITWKAPDNQGNPTRKSRQSTVETVQLAAVNNRLHHVEPADDRLAIDNAPTSLSIAHTAN